jgi:phosphohistidine swiveling domain-containing protein
VLKPKPLVLDLLAAAPEELGLVGGKAANLGVLLRAGFPVPPGVCLTTVGYSRAVGGALDDVVAHLAATKPHDTARLAELAALARVRVLQAWVPDDVAEAVRGIATGPVAVRSSATAEDLPSVSFAGQQDSFLNVVGDNAVLDAVRRCWASLWSDRAVIYRAAHGIDSAAVQLAVVVQQMVPARVAGVLFTANPVTGRRCEAVVDASPGLGEAVVSGAVNPDHFVVDVESGTVLEQRLGDRRLVVQAVPGGGVEHLEPASGWHGGPCLTPEQLRSLARLGAEVEQCFGAPQDIEWAVDDGDRVWITQSRPITTLFPVPEGRGGFRAFFSFSVAQGVYRPLTPMGIAGIRAVSTSVARLWGISVRDPLLGAPALTVAAGRIFIDATPALRDRLGRAVVPRVLDLMEARSAVVLRSLAEDQRFALQPSSRSVVLRRLVAVLVRHRVPVRVVWAVADPPRAHRAAQEVGSALRERARVAPDATPGERLDHVERLLTREFASMALQLLPGAVAGFATLGLAVRLLGKDLHPGELPVVLRSVPDNVTTSMDLALWKLATQVRADADSKNVVDNTSPEELTHRFRRGGLPSVLQQGLDEFLAQYGARAVAEIDLGLPRWSQDPTYVLGVLGTYLKLTDPAAAPDVVFARGQREAEAKVEELAHRRRGVRRQVVRFVLRRCRALVGMRELPKFYLVSMLAGVRHELQVIGEQLAGRALLGRADDVFFLDLHEVRSALEGADLRARVAERRAEYDRELQRRHLPRVLLSDGTEPEATVAAATVPSGALLGTAASAGTVTATAAVVLEPDRAAFEPGAILVCPSTDPGWTPLFLTAGGLVMEMGGANSHGAVVAREYGIPAVVGVADATQRIVTGDTVTVDGVAGTVTIQATRADPTRAG